MAKVKKESEFRTWFEAQHGPRLRKSETDKQLERWIEVGGDAQREMARRREWDARWESALYAWQAAPKSTV